MAPIVIKHKFRKYFTCVCTDILSNLQRLLVSQQQQPALVTPNTFTLCLHILVLLASNSTTISLQLLRQVTSLPSTSFRSKAFIQCGSGYMVLQLIANTEPGLDCLRVPQKI